MGINTSQVQFRFFDKLGVGDFFAGQQNFSRKM